ncbi:MAG: hypothetical protein HN849_08545 [Victivallales bacterium]|jgi:hypothetical protein|nr:hypothetical protein [Victivallales bacterium]
MSAPTNAELLEATSNAILRLVEGVKFAQVSGNQYHYSSLPELRALKAELEVAVAEEAGTDGRGAWEATFSE